MYGIRVWLSIVLIAIMAAGCSERKTPTGEYAGAQAYLESKGYKVVSYEGRTESYELTKSKLVSLPHMIYWGVQSVDASRYLGGNVEVHKFIVNHHPLAKGKVDVYVYEVNGQPVGGTSFPHGAQTAGGYWSLDGQTLEQIQSKTFQEWRTDWTNKFADSTVQ